MAGECKYNNGREEEKGDGRATFWRLRAEWNCSVWWNLSFTCITNRWNITLIWFFNFISRWTVLYCIFQPVKQERRLATSSVANWCLLQKSYGKNHNRQPTKILNVVHTLYVHRSCPIPKTRFACIPVGRGPPFVGEGSLKIIQLTNCIDSQKVSNAVSDSVIILRNMFLGWHINPLPYHDFDTVKE